MTGSELVAVPIFRSCTTFATGTRAAVLPMHGGKKQLGKGLMKAIKKQLGLK